LDETGGVNDQRERMNTFIESCSAGKNAPIPDRLDFIYEKTFRLPSLDWDAIQ
jgi:hypothetical protein